MIVFVGPSPKPITGQSLAFDIITSHYNKKKKVIYYGVNSRSKFLILWGSFFSFFRFLCFLLIQRNIKTLYLTTSRTTFGFFRDMLFILTAKFFSVKVVNHLHGADFKGFRSSLSPNLRKLVDYVYKKIDTSIVLLPKMEEQYDMYSSMNIVSINNCALPIANLPRNDSLGFFKVLYLSNIMYSKGILFVIEAVDNLVKLGVRVQLSIAGLPMGDDYKSVDEIQSIFQEMITNKSHIEYLEAVTGTVKEQLLIDSDVFILPSFYKTEAQPISIIEAMLSGCAVITTKHNYLSDIVNTNSGFAIEPRSAKEIESSLLELITNETKLKDMANYNKSYAEEHYSLDKYVRQISAVLDT